MTRSASASLKNILISSQVVLVLTHDQHQSAFISDMSHRLKTCLINRHPQDLNTEQDRSYTAI